MVVRKGTREESGLIAMLIGESNRDVAERFGLNEENCPKHPSFCTPEWVEADFKRGETYFICENNHSPIGCVAFENPAPGVAYLNRLAVLPDQRRQGKPWSGISLRIHKHSGSRPSASVSLPPIGN